MVFSDNKRQSINSHSFKKQILKAQVNNTLSDEKRQPDQELAQNNFNQYQREQYQRVNGGKVEVTSPSANIGETETE